jgi:uncharacterized membrane protein
VVDASGTLTSSLTPPRTKIDPIRTTEVKLRPEDHLQGREHEEVTHVDDRLVNKTVVVERTTGSASSSKGKEGGGGACCGGGCGGKQ